MVLQYILILKWLLTLMNIFLVYLLVRTLQVFQWLIQLVPHSLTTPLKSLLQLFSVSYVLALQSNKSPGPDGWPITIIKSVSEFISVPLSILFNKSLNSGSVPSDWKCANVTPIYKKGARNLACNY